MEQLVQIRRIIQGNGIIQEIKLDIDIVNQEFESITHLIPLTAHCRFQYNEKLQSHIYQFSAYIQKNPVTIIPDYTITEIDFCAEEISGYMPLENFPNILKKLYELRTLE